MREVKKDGGQVSGVAVMVDRSNGSVSLHNNQFSIIALDAISYSENNIPDSLIKIPVQKPGSRSKI